jgi:hypothetical protein
MNMKTTKKYIHPRLGEVWIAIGTKSMDLLEAKMYNELNKHLDLIWK